MRNKSKVLVLMLSAAALVAASVFGTMAYLTDNDQVTNTFTIGKVTLGDGNLEKGLDEAKVDEYGTLIPDVPRVQENTYKLIPGHTYIKDPTVHIGEDSESCWVFVKIVNGLVEGTVNIEAATENTEGGYKTVADQITANEWKPLKNGNEPVPNVYYKQWTKPTGTVNDDYYDLLVFEEFKINGDGVDNTILGAFENAQIVVTAYAVQLDGFENNAYGAWTAAEFN